MATLQEKMAESLEILKAYQDRHGDNLVIHEAGVLGRTNTGEMPWRQAPACPWSGR